MKAVSSLMLLCCVGLTTPSEAASPTLHDAAVAAHAEWKSCVLGQARDLAARSAETADVIATAAMASCASEQSAFRTAVRADLADAVANKMGSASDPEIADRAKVMIERSVNELEAKAAAALRDGATAAAVVARAR